MRAACRAFEGVKNRSNRSPLAACLPACANDDELAAAAIARAKCSATMMRISISSEIGSMGLVERETPPF